MLEPGRLPPLVRVLVRFLLLAAYVPLAEAEELDATILCYDGVPDLALAPD